VPTGEDKEMIRFSEHLIMGGYKYACGLAVADLNGDGKLDIVACAERGSNEVRWGKNEGRE